MNLTLKSALIELRSDGVNLDPIADLEYILTLDKLSRKIKEAFTPGGDAPVLRPVLKIGKLTLRRLSVGAQRFLVDIVSEWIPDDARQQDLAYIFAMASTPEQLWALQHSKKDFLKALTAWERTVDVSLPELSAAVKRFLADGQEADECKSGQTAASGAYRGAMHLLGRLRPLPEAYRTECQAALVAMEAEEEERGGGYGMLIETLIKEYGHDADHWLWRVSAQELDLLMSARNEKQDAEIRAMKGAQDDRMQRAHYAFVQYVEMVRKLKKGLKP